MAVFDDYWAPTLSFAISLGRKGVPLHFYGRGAGRFSRYCTESRACPPMQDAARFLPWLRAQVRLGAIERVAPTTDMIAYYVSFMREEFPPAVQRTIPPLAEIETHLIKTKFAVACQQIGQATPDIAAPDDLDAAVDCAGALGYPLMLKPKSHLVVGSKQRGRLIRNSTELSSHYRAYAVAPGQHVIAELYPQLLWPMLQRYVASARERVYSVTGIKDPDRGITVASLSFKCEQWPPDVGISTLQVGCHDEDILRRGLGTIERLVSRGIFELELLSEGPRLLAIDLNPRAFGFIALDMALGNDLPWLWLQSTLAPVTPLAVPDSRAVEVRARHHVIRLFRTFTTWPSSASASTTTQPRQNRAAGPRSTISMVGSLSDPVPMVIANLQAVQGVARHALRTVSRIARLTKN